MHMFIEQVEEQLRRMSGEEKDKWILCQARLLAESEQEGFLLSLSGEKKVGYMPSDREIREFCEKVDRGEIYVEYEAHYYEFDDDGRYMDDWLVWHNDPLGAMDFLDKVFRGCHDLVILSEYKEAADILDRVCRLRFQVREAADSEDFEDESPFTVEDLLKENMLSVNGSDIGEDWARAFVRKRDQWDCGELAAAMADIFLEPVCGAITPSILAGEKLPDQFFARMGEIIDQELCRGQDTLEERFSNTNFSDEKMALEKRVERLICLKSDIRSICGS